MPEIRIAGIAASSRSRCNEKKMMETVLDCRDRTDLEYTIEKMSFSKQISNSDACLMASLFGVHQEHGGFDVIRLRSFFPGKHPDSPPRNSRKLLKISGEADGFIISSPVYFGDCSSYLGSFFNYLRANRLLENRVVGVDSVGAKRNGGQETAIIFALSEASRNGAIVCGNGPSTSQYGGTAWAGDLGSVREDAFGIDTSVGLGHKVARVAQALKHGQGGKTDDLRVSFWITKDRDSIMDKSIRATVGKLKKKFSGRIRFRILDLTKLELKRCIGCSVCPFYFDKSDKYGIFRDKIQDDDMKKIYTDLIDTDAVIVAGYNPVEPEGVNDIYRIFVERTRQIRRDNFLLTDVPVAAYSMEEVGQSNPFSMKVMTSFIRQNMIILPPIEQYLNDGKALNDPYGRFVDFIDTAARIRKGKTSLKALDTRYRPIGYNT
jgi:multimeric flavodoxin WrbA